MENDDWIKFGYVIWASATDVLKTQALQSYRRAWKSLYDSEPMLEGDGPVDFLNNPKYTCSHLVPWRPRVEARFSVQVPEASTSTPSPRRQPAPVSPFPTGPAPSFSPLPHPADDKPNESLLGQLKAASFDAAYDSPYPRIKNGLFPGFCKYIDNPAKKMRLRVVFPIIPQYRIINQDDKPTSDVSTIEISQADFMAISKHEPNCLYAAADQSKCARGKTRYFCSSWVRLFSSFSPSYLSSSPPQAHSRSGDVGTPVLVGCEVFELAVLYHRRHSPDRSCLGLALEL
jgi:hypothetical protein